MTTAMLVTLYGTNNAVILRLMMNRVSNKIDVAEANAVASDKFNVAEANAHRTL